LTYEREAKGFGTGSFMEAGHLGSCIMRKLERDFVPQAAAKIFKNACSEHT
jgi:hypothetical protein